MSELEHLLVDSYERKYPEFVLELNKLWDRSYTDITGIAFVLDPLSIYIRYSKGHALHDSIKGPIAAHESSIYNEIVDNLKVPRSELNLFLNDNKDFFKAKNVIDGKWLLYKYQKVLIIYLGIPRCLLECC